MDKFRKWLSVKEAKKLGLKEKPNTEGRSQSRYSITEEQFEKLSVNLHTIDLRNVVEMADNTNLVDQAACAGNNCEII